MVASLLVFFVLFLRVAVCRWLFVRREGKSFLLILLCFFFVLFHTYPILIHRFFYISINNSFKLQVSYSPCYEALTM
jgi:4-amino-4-deoxy-L-arabinose transferase-like glycosyltransferase